MSKPKQDCILFLWLFLATSQPKYTSQIKKVERHQQRARNRGLPDTLTLFDWYDILDAHDWKCKYCGGPPETMEHIKPVGMGGGTTPDNCVPCCHRCNQQRNYVAYATQSIEWLIKHKSLHVIADLMPHRRKLATGLLRLLVSSIL